MPLLAEMNHNKVYGEESHLSCLSCTAPLFIGGAGGLSCTASCTEMRISCTTGLKTTSMSGLSASCIGDARS